MRPNPRKQPQTFELRQGWVVPPVDDTGVSISIDEKALRSNANRVHRDLAKHVLCS